jgi:hypothetical protein
MAMLVSDATNPTPQKRKEGHPPVLEITAEIVSSKLSMLRH